MVKPDKAKSTSSSSSFECSNNGPSTLCVHCEKEQVISNKILSICEICKLAHQSEFDEASEQGKNKKMHNVKLSLFEIFTQVKTEHALRVLNAKKETNDMKKTKQAIAEISEKLNSPKKKITAYNPKNNKKNSGPVIAYVLPCFSRFYMPSM